MRVTKATLKKYARKGQMMHEITSEFDGMIDGMRQILCNEKLHHSKRLQDI